MTVLGRDTITTIARTFLSWLILRRISIFRRVLIQKGRRTQNSFWVSDKPEFISINEFACVYPQL